VPTAQRIIVLDINLYWAAFRQIEEMPDFARYYVDKHVNANTLFNFIYMYLKYYV